VNDVEGVQKADAHDDLLGDFGCVVLVEEDVVLDEFEEVFALDEFSDDVEMAFGLHALLEFEEQGMGDDLHNAALVTV
jgi:hypothetical protein